MPSSPSVRATGLRVSEAVTRPDGAEDRGGGAILERSSVAAREFATPNGMTDRPPRLRAISLFSGIGGLDLGFQRAGIETVLQVEIDPFCREVLARHWPDVRRIADVHDVTDADVQGVDVVMGGFPCQPVSLAGKRLAQTDERWLWPEFERVVRMARPRYVVVENVPGLLSAGLGDVLGGLSALGFDAEWSIVSACSLGAPYPRERLFIIANFGGEGLPVGGDAGAHQADARGFSEGVEPARRAPPAWLECRSAAYWGGGVHGIPRRVDRLRALGNAVVPQVAEVIGRRLVAVDALLRATEAAA